MSRTHTRRRTYTRRTRTHTRRRTTGLGLLGGFLVVLIFALLLGGIAATTPVPDGVVGFLFIVICAGVWIAR